MESNEVGWWMVPEEKHYVDRDSSILGGDEYDSFMGEFIWNLGVAMFPTCFVMKKDKAVYLTTGQVISIADGRMACDYNDLLAGLSLITGPEFLSNNGTVGTANFVKNDVLMYCPWVYNLPTLEIEGTDKESAVREWVTYISTLYGGTHVIYTDEDWF